MSGVFSEEPNAFFATCRCSVALIVYEFNVDDSLCIQEYSRPYFSSGLKHFKFLTVGVFKSRIYTYFTATQSYTITTKQNLNIC